MRLKSWHKSESYPSHVSPQDLASRWNEVASKSVGESNRFDAVVIPAANHKVDSNKAQATLVTHVMSFLEKIRADFDTQEAENQAVAAPSFDEVVELISTGRAESIPGVKSIPLKVRNRRVVSLHLFDNCRISAD